MGGCASKPKDLEVNNTAKPVEAPAAEKTEPEPVAQENNGGEETKTEEPLVHPSEPTEEAKEASELKTEEPTEVAETKAEEKVEAKAEAEPKAETKAEAAPAEASASAAPAEASASAAPAEAGAAAAAAVVASETEKTPEIVKETKAAEAQTSEDKSDAPLVTM